MADLPPCPRCSTPIQPDWDWCRSCGYDPLGSRPADAAGEDPSTARAAEPVTSSVDPMGGEPRTGPRNVYEPDRPVSPIVYGLVGLAGIVLVSLLALAIVRSLEDEPTSETNLYLPGGEIDLSRGITDLGDGWFRIEVDDGAAATDLPGPLLRSRADPLVGRLGQLPMAVWGGGRTGEEVYGVAVAEIPDDWQGQSETLLANVPLPVELDVFERSRRAVDVGGPPAVEISAEGRDGELWALVVADGDRLVIVLYGSASGDLDAVTDRIRGSLTLG